MRVGVAPPLPKHETAATARPTRLLQWASWAPVFILILLNLSIGVLISSDFGISWDDPADAAYGADSLRSYGDPSFDWSTYSKRRYYGPAHFMVQNLGAPLLTQLIPEWGEPEARRLINLLAFQVAILAMFIFARQLVGYFAAVTATFLFGLQPLYFGHAFINGKDTPFMGMFLLAVAVGFVASRSMPRSAEGLSAGPNGATQGLRTLLRQDLQAAPRSHVVGLALALALPAALFAEFYVFNAVVRPQILQLVTQAYNQTAPAMINALFDQIAENRGVLPVDAYLDRVSKLLVMARLPLVAVAAIPLAFVAGRALPLTRRALWRAAQSEWRVLRESLLRDWPSARHLSLLVAAGLVGGIAISIRVAGLLAIFLVGIFYLFRHRAKAIPPLAVYASVAAVVCFATWPYLWNDPVGNFLESYSFMLGALNKGYVLFMGTAIKGRLLPWYYLPSLMFFQFTEPVWLLMLAAGLLLMTRRLNPGPSPSFLVVLLLWLLVPTVPLILRHAWFYDNFRQFLFVTPVFFLFSAYGLDYGFRLISKPLLRVGLVLLILLPGAIQIVQLHPYQYVYYNSFVGGTRGAVRQFELDYWATSYAEAMRYLNGVLPEEAVVGFWGTTAAALPHARSDLVIQSFNLEEDLRAMSADVAVMISRANIDLGILPCTPPLAEISVGNALLAVIKPVPTHVESCED